jgi:SAM-dependent methyltransferase
MAVGDGDPRRQQGFAERLMDLSNSGSLALMVSVGHRTGLFDTMASLPPATSAEIADNACLDERYVREWLAAMATGRIVEFDPVAMTFALPAEHAASLTRAAGPHNSAVAFQLLGMFAAVEDRVVECFRRGGAVADSEYPRFQEICAEIGWASLDANLVDVTLALVPGLTDSLRAGIDVADVGCGSGHAINVMAEAFPASRFVGWDLSETALAAGRAEAERRQLANVSFERQDVAVLDQREQFDFITTFGAVHDQAWPDLVLNAISTALRSSGIYLCVEVAASSTLGENLDIPWAPALYTASCMHCLCVSRQSGGMALGPMWGEQKARQMLGEAGFASLRVERSPLDPVNNYYIAAKTGGPGTWAHEGAGPVPVPGGPRPSSVR